MSVLGSQVFGQASMESCELHRKQMPLRVCPDMRQVSDITYMYTFVSSRKSFLDKARLFSLVN